MKRRPLKKQLLAGVLALTLGLLPLNGCTEAQAVQPLSPTAAPLAVTPARSQNADNALADLGLTLLRAQRTEEQGALLSPLSFALALSMAANGAQGETLQQFTDLFGVEDLDALNAACAAWMEALETLGGSTQTTLANSLWADPEGQIKDSFIAACQGVFDAQVFQMELAGRDAMEAVNRWVSEGTQGLIPSLVDQPFDEDTAALLVNALYLKNAWKVEFEPENTRERDFFHADGAAQGMDFLNRGNCELPYFQLPGAQGAILPYDDGKLGFFAVMPDDPGLESWLEGLDGTELTEGLRAAQETRFLHLGLPKFEAEWKGNLAGALADAGLELAFSPAADFSALGDHSDGYYIGRVVHGTKLAVNEKGTEAAAATVVEMRAGAAAPQDGVSLVFDRPFLYGIAELETGLPLFLGTFE